MTIKRLLAEQINPSTKYERVGNAALSIAPHSFPITFEMQNAEYCARTSSQMQIKCQVFGVPFITPLHIRNYFYYLQYLVFPLESIVLHAIDCADSNVHVIRLI